MLTAYTVVSKYEITERRTDLQFVHSAWLEIYPAKQMQVMKFFKTNAEKLTSQCGNCIFRLVLDMNSLWGNTWLASAAAEMACYYIISWDVIIIMDPYEQTMGSMLFCLQTCQLIGLSCIAQFKIVEDETMEGLWINAFSRYSCMPFTANSWCDTLPT